MPSGIRLKHPAPDITIEADAVMDAHLGIRITEKCIDATYRAGHGMKDDILMSWPSRPEVKFILRRLSMIFIEKTLRLLLH